MDVKDVGKADTPVPVVGAGPSEPVIVEDTTEEEMRVRQLEQEAEVIGGKDVTPGVEFEEFERELGGYGEDHERSASRAASARKSLSQV
jgi:hypothetical protein